MSRLYLEMLAVVLMLGGFAIAIVKSLGGEIIWMWGAGAMMILGFTILFIYKIKDLEEPIQKRRKK